MSEPKMARKSSYVAKCGAGKTYAWWGCKQSGTKPYCNGTHSTL